MIEGRAVEDYADNPEWKVAHREFHESLVAACGSPTLLGIRQSLFERAERYRNISARFRPRPRDKAGEHRALMKAAVGRDADRACETDRKAHPDHDRQRHQIRLRSDQRRARPDAAERPAPKGGVSLRRRI